MDFGDLLLGLLVLSGVASSFFGGKKKAGQQNPPRQSPAQKRQAVGERPKVGTGNPQMDDILRQLGFETPAKPNLTETTPPKEVIEVPEVPRVAPYSAPPPRAERVQDYPEVPEARSFYRPMPQVVSLEPILYGDEEAESEIRHEAFHDQYVRPVEGPKEKAHLRIRRYLKAGAIRDGVILREILGPPKGLE